MKKSNRVYGVFGVKSLYSNANANFQGQPRTMGDEYYISHASIKYPIRKFWDNRGKKVFNLSSYEFGDKDFSYRIIKNRYMELFGETLKPNTKVVVAQNLFRCVDIMNFGASFAVEKNNVSITGAVQFSQGINRFDGTLTYRHEVHAPFATESNKSNESKENTSLGSQSFTQEAHYFSGITITPENYNEWRYLPGFEGYTQEAYELFKLGAMVGASHHNTHSKAGLDNEFLFLVEVKEDSILALPNLQEKVYLENDTSHPFLVQGKIDLNTMMKYLSSFKDEIHFIEYYHDPDNTVVFYDDDFGMDIRQFHIRTGKSL